MSKQVQILSLAAFYNEGARGLAGGAAKNDKVWGVAKVDGGVYTFWGRRNGALRTKRVSMADAMTSLDKKLGGRTSGDVYTAVAPNSPMAKALCPTLAADVAAAV